MENFEIIRGGQRMDAKSRQRARRVRAFGQIVGMAVKAGLYVGTGVAVSRTIIWASDVSKTRLLIPGGEIFTIPLIIALFLVGWALRGDVERGIRRREREQRRRQNDRRD
jgi:hypothetical protein